MNRKPRARYLRIRRDGGMAMAITLMIAAIIVVLESYLSSQGVQTLTAANADNYQQTSLYAAEAAIAAAKYQLNATPTWSPTSSTASPYWASSFDATAAPSPTPYPIASATPAPQFTPYYSVQVLNNVSGTGSQSLTASQSGLGQAITVPSGAAFVVAKSYVQFGSGQKYSRIASVMLTSTSSSPSPFQYAMTSTSTSSDLLRGTIDSYNSGTNGTPTPYGSGNSGSPATVVVDATPGSTASTIVTTKSLSGNVTVGIIAPSPSGYVSDANGPSATPSSVASSTTMITPTPSGSPSSTKTTYTSNVTLTPGVYGDVTVNGGATLTLNGGGQYDFSNLSLGGGANIVLSSSVTSTNPAVVYFTGTLTLSGGAVGNYSSSSSTVNSGNPGALQFMGSGTATSVTISGGGTIAAVIYAPTAAITMQGTGADVYGALVGSSLNMNASGGGLHYDTALSSLNISLSGGGTIKTTTYARI